MTRQHARKSLLWRLIPFFLLLLLTGCKATLYSGLNEREGNEMLAILLTAGLSAENVVGKDRTVQLMVEESQISLAIDLLKRNGYPKENYSSINDLFPKDGLITSPVEERARFIYAVSQGIASTLSNIDGVLTARVHVVLPENKDRLSDKSEPASASVFIKHAADISLEAHIPQIKLLVNNAIEGLVYDRISIVLFPSADVKRSPTEPQLRSILSIKMTTDSVSTFMIVLAMLAMVSLLSQFVVYSWYRRRLSSFGVD